MSVSLDPLFRPRSIAVIGASPTPGKHGYVVVHNLIKGGYSGRIFPVNPRGEDVLGFGCYRTMAEIPEPVDCAMMVIPAGAVVDAVRDCAAAGARAAVVGANGFAETGTDEGRARQRALTEIARTNGMRLLGPNTNGLLNASDHLSLGYNAEHGEAIEAGSVSIVSHSGALFGGVVRSLRQLGMGVAKFVPVGNEADVTMLDVIDFLIDDDATRVIGLVMEGLSDGARLRRLAQRAQQAGKPMVALKVGRSAVGAEAALAHSSRLAGSARAYDALYAACAIASVRSVEALAGGCALLAGRTAKAIRGDQRLVCVTSSGAGGALLADFAAERGMVLAGDRAGEWQGAAAEAIAALPASGRIRNPVDTGSLRGDWSRITDVYQALEKDGITGPTAVYAHIAPSPVMDQKLEGAVLARHQRTETPVVVAAPGGLSPEREAAFIKAGIPVFHDLSTCFESLNCHYQTLRPADPGAAPDAAAGMSTAGRLLKAAASRAGTETMLSEIDSAAVLLDAGVPMVASRVVATPAEAREAAAALGYPLVLKALAPGVAHKNDAGLVAVGLADAAALDAAWAAQHESLKVQGIGDDTVTMVVQPMKRSEAELIVGVSREPGLGAFLVVGLGGIHAEALDTVTLMPIPLGTAAIRSRLTSARLGGLLARLGDGATAAVTAVLEALQRLMVAHGDMIDSIDVNPLLVGRDGCVAVDALVVASKRQT